MKKIGDYQENDIITTPAPLSTDSYTAISHGWIVNRIDEELDKLNIGTEKRVYTANQGYNQVIGQFHLKGGFADSSKVKPSIAFGNSYDKSKKFMAASGLIVALCSNGMISGEDIVKYSRKHTGSAIKDVEEMIQHAVSNLKETYEKLNKQIEVMETINISKTMAAEYLGRLYFEEGILTPTQLNRTKDAYFEDENFKCFEDESTTLYNLYNNVTESLKSSHPSQYIQKHGDFNQFITHEFEVEDAKVLV